MKNIVIAALVSFFVAGTAFAVPGMLTCADQAAAKNLAGAAKNSFIAKCEKEAGAPETATSSCEAQAVSKDGKPLAGAAKAASIKKCEKEAAATAAPSCEAKAVSKDGKPLAGAAKAASIKKCEADAKK